MAHFNSFVRIPMLVLRHSLAPLAAIPPLDEDLLHFRVWPNGIDFNFHLNNARYLTVMDYARVHLLARAQVLEHVLRERWTPVLGAVWITYRRPLPLWAAYRLATRLVGWDDRWFYIEQVFTAGETLAAVGWVKGALLARPSAGSGPIPPQRVMELVQPGILSPELPDAIGILNGLTREKLQSAL